MQVCVSLIEFAHSENEIPFGGFLRVAFFLFAIVVCSNNNGCPIYSCQQNPTQVRISSVWLLPEFFRVVIFGVVSFRF